MTPPNLSIQEKICLLTGATGGLGKATATHLARKGATVVIVGRDPQRMEAALREIREKSSNPKIIGLCGDLSTRAGIFQVANEYSSQFERLDVLVNNVGATLLKYHATRDGLEMSWALNYLLHFYLTNLLLDRLTMTAARYGEARILEITSSMFRFASGDFSKRQGPQRYNGVQAYAQSKRAMMVFTCEMARRLTGTGVTINAITPGFVATSMAAGDATWARLMMVFIRMVSATPEKGAEPIAYLASAPEVYGISGAYYQRWQPQPVSPDISSESAGRALWLLSTAMLAEL